MNYVELMWAFSVGFFEKTTDSDPFLFANCTYHSQMLLVYYQFAELHAVNFRWEPLIEAINEQLIQVDPAAKACMPIYVAVFILSDYYGPSFSNANRIMMNTLYRLGRIYANGAEINRKVFMFLSDKTEFGEEKNIQHYITDVV